MRISEYEGKIELERKWHVQSGFRAGHFLNSKLFFSKERTHYNHIFPRKRLSKLAAEIFKTGNLTNPAVLIAPIGSGQDIPYFKDLAGEISGVDISEEAISRIKDENVKKYVGDIKHMDMFPDNCFDAVIAPFFFHHYCRIGFDDFLKEIHRVLKPAGHFFSLEPSSLNPVSCIAKFLKKVFGNITGLVEGEAAFIPFKLSRAMKRSGFHGITVYGAGFVHNRAPIWAAKIINIAAYPFLGCPVVKYFSWMCLFYGKKSRNDQGRF